jgi:glycosyltransferase involved in cell wall biosynthesis
MRRGGSLPPDQSPAVRTRRSKMLHLFSLFLLLLLQGVLGISVALQKNGDITAASNTNDTSTNHTLCLNMIVKDEAHVLPRLLASIQDYIDYYVIVDTGSTDETISILASAISSTSTATLRSPTPNNNNSTPIYSSMGEIHQRPWINFGYNRNEALQLAVAAGCHWVLIMDADDLLVVQNRDFKMPTNAGLVNGRIYLLEKRQGTFVNAVPRLIDVQAYTWEWKGPIHEYLSCRDNDCDQSTEETRQDIWIAETRGESGRSLGVTEIEKYQRDAQILTEYLQQHPDSAREQFYLARSYMDAGEYALALSAYRKRMTMGDWQEEVVYSQLEIGRIMIHLSQSPEDVMKEYLAAHVLKPQLGEPLYELAMYFWEMGDMAKAFLFAKAGVDLPRPKAEENVFLNYDYYDYGFLSLVCSSAYYIHRFQEGKQACQEIIRRDEEQSEFSIPQNERFDIWKYWKLHQNAML